MNRQCSACLVYLDISFFHVDNASRDGFKARCKSCSKHKIPSTRRRFACKICGAPAAVRSQHCAAHRQNYVRKTTGNASTHKYEKTKHGFVMRAYRNMLSRVSGVQHKKAHLYAGLEIMPKEAFYGWALRDSDFNNLFAYWEQVGHNQSYTPSVDRIDSSKGYVEGNIRWITHSENSRLGNLSRWRS